MRSAAADISAAAAALRRGELVALPTETYFALAARALDPAALARLFAKKGRADGHTLSLLIEPEFLDQVVASVPAAARGLMAAWWPGPLTLALPARPGLSDAICEDGYVAVRVTPDPIARAVLRALAEPVTATSANPSGAPPARTAAEVRAYFPDLLVIGDGPTPGGAPSTLARVSADGVISVLRKGPIDLKD